MSRALLALLALLAVSAGSAACAEPGQAGTASGQTEISVSGNGSVSLAPDIATVSAAVETNAPTANRAVEENNAIYDRVVTAVTRAGVARDDITLSYYNVNDNPRPHVMPPQPTGERYGFTVSRGFNIKVRNINDAGRVVDAATSAGATSIGSISFGVNDPSRAQNQAIRLAMDDSRRSAESLAAATDLRVLSIKSIQFSGGNVAPPVPMMKAAMVASSTQFDQSNVNVSVSVSVVYLAGP